MKISQLEKEYLLSLVKQVLYSCVADKKRLEDLSFGKLPSEILAKQCGAFVTYYKNNTEKKELRGCIGLMEGLYPLWETVVRMAYAAAFHDTRFLPIRKDELPDIVYEITVLTPFVSCMDIAEIELGRHGIMFECEGHRSVFLSQVPLEQGWDKIQTFEFLALKAGLSANAWMDSQAKFFIFECIVLTN